MGITIHDTLTFPNGLSASDTYVSLRYQTIHINSSVKNGVFRWALLSDYNIWANKSVCESGGPCLDRQSVVVMMTPEQMSSSVFELLYDAIKAKYEVTTDV